MCLHDRSFSGAQVVVSVGATTAGNALPRVGRGGRGSLELALLISGKRVPMLSNKPSLCLEDSLHAADVVSARIGRGGIQICRSQGWYLHWAGVEIVHHMLPCAWSILHVVERIQVWLSRWLNIHIFNWLHCWRVVGDWNNFPRKYSVRNSPLVLWLFRPRLPGILQKWILGITNHPTFTHGRIWVGPARGRRSEINIYRRRRQIPIWLRRIVSLGEWSGVFRARPQC
mmetsp:Transcript_7175/g.11320  ORF Transcript_7175/g.11320 Transcript_7175/m.11320 type:complete len:228 (+) Transcript_7175:365-1048(+)